MLRKTAPPRASLPSAVQRQANVSISDCAGGSNLRHTDIFVCATLCSFWFDIASDLNPVRFAKPETTIPHIGRLLWVDPGWPKSVLFAPTHCNAGCQITQIKRHRKVSSESRLSFLCEMFGGVCCAFLSFLEFLQILAEISVRLRQWHSYRRNQFCPNQ